MGIMAAAPEAMSCSDVCGKSVTIRVNRRCGFFFGGDELPLTRSTTANSRAGAGLTGGDNSESARRGIAGSIDKGCKPTYPHISKICFLITLKRSPPVERALLPRPKRSPPVERALLARPKRSPPVERALLARPRGRHPWSAPCLQGRGGRHPWSAPCFQGRGGRHPWSAPCLQGRGEQREIVRRT